MLGGQHVGKFTSSASGPLPGCSFISWSLVPDALLTLGFSPFLRVVVSRAFSFSLVFSLVFSCCFSCRSLLWLLLSLVHCSLCIPYSLHLAESHFSHPSFSGLGRVLHMSCLQVHAHVLLCERGISLQHSVLFSFELSYAIGMCMIVHMRARACISSFRRLFRYTFEYRYTFEHRARSSPYRNITLSFSLPYLPLSLSLSLFFFPPFPLFGCPFWSRILVVTCPLLLSIPRSHSIPLP